MSDQTRFNAESDAFGPEDFLPSQQRVLKLLRHGLINRQIAEQLKISVETVKEHVGNMLKRTGCRDRADLTRWVNDRIKPQDEHYAEQQLSGAS